MTDKEKQKLRGGYYTPSTITDFITKWALENNGKKILEPSCGDGEFIESIMKEIIVNNSHKDEIPTDLVAIEVDQNEAAKVKRRIQKYNEFHNIRVISGDFFEFCKEALSNECKFDVVVGNPPFIKYQNFEEKYREIAFELLKGFGFSPTRLTNIWIPFLILSSYLLNDTGRFGMVIPTELFQVNYAAETRKFLSEYFDRINIITFNSLIFEGAQQEVIVLLAERKSKSNGIKVIELENISELEQFDYNLLHNNSLKNVDHDSEKWTKYFLEESEIKLLRQLKKHEMVISCDKVLEVNVGVVTGLNKYFVINDEIREEFKLNSFTIPIVSRSMQLKGISYSNTDILNDSNEGKPIYLFSPDNIEYEKQPSVVKKYIDKGISNNVNGGYKCRIRKNWYVVPQTWIPEAFMLRQVHIYPKLVINNTKATCTDTIHKVRFKENYKSFNVATSFLNSMTFAFAEITGRSYGGGVLTFEPSEIRSLPIAITEFSEADYNKIDELMKKNKIDEVLDITDRIILKKYVGLSDEEVVMLRNIWRKLSSRRNRRKKTKVL